VLVNECRKILRRRKREGAPPGGELPEPADPHDWGSGIVWRDAMGSLDEKYREVLVLYYALGLDTTEIGRALGLPVSTVTTRMQRGREQLAAYFAPRPGEGADQ
jgi:DNA-directed RNA polymerase specialized sigma24 family protein